MNKKWIVAILIFGSAGLMAVNYLQTSRGGDGRVSSTRPSRSSPDTTVSPSDPDALIPAHYESPPSSLPATLGPERLQDKTREAYQVAKDIPRTLAQLPCYCYCDRGMGHKSLHGCFEDDHAAQCAVCTDEALMAYRLQKRGLTPKQIRERIVEEFSDQ
jgi:hypothetical protein